MKKKFLKFALSLAMVVTGALAFGSSSEAKEPNEKIPYNSEKMSVSWSIGGTAGDSSNMQNTEGQVADMFDGIVHGNNDSYFTIGHDGNQSIAEGNTWIQVDLGGTYVINQVDYTPRWYNASSNYWACTGNVKKLVVEISGDGQTWTEVTPVDGLDISDKVQAVNDATYYPVHVTFNATKARYVRVRGNKSEHWKSENEDKFIAVGELAFYKVTETNLAQGKNVIGKWTSSNTDVDVNSSKPLTNIVDGNKGDTNNYADFGHDDKEESSYIQVDFGEVCDVTKLNLYRYWNDSRIYDGTVIALSETADFATKTIVYNSDTTGELHALGAGTDTTYAESSAGKEIIVKDEQGNATVVRARYVRVYMHGRSNGNTNHIVELQAWGYESPRTSLQKLYDANSGRENTDATYVASGWNTFVNALNAAKSVLDNAEATDDELVSAKTELYAAINGLVDKRTAEILNENGVITATACGSHSGSNTDGGPSFALDNNGNTLWHTPYSNGATLCTHENMQHWFMFELNPGHKVYSLNYTSRSGGANSITQYQIFVRNSEEEEWKEVDVKNSQRNSSGYYEWAGNDTLKTAEFVTPVCAKYIKLQIRAIKDNSVHVAASKIYLTGVPAADYTAVDAAIAEVKANRNWYTEESLVAVDTAIEAVDWNKDADAQEEVDDMAEAINAAIDGLVMKENVSWYSFDNIEEGIVNDEWNTRNGQLVDGAQTAKGVKGNALLVTEASKGVNVVGENLLTDDWTVSFWVKVDSGFSTEAWALKNTDGTYGCVVDRGNATNDIAFRVRNADNSSNIFGYSGEKLESGKWHHMAYVSRKTPGMVSVYVDGRELVSGGNGWRNGTDRGHVDALAPFDIIGAQGFVGMIDEVKVYSSVLSADKIQTLANDVDSADYTALTAAIATAEALNADDYKDFSNVETALAEAKALVNESVDVRRQTDVDTATQNLTNAITALKYEFKIYGASLSLEDNLTVNFKVAGAGLAKDGYSDLVVKVMFNEKETIIDSYDVVDGTYIFRFTNIAPQCMNDDMSVTLCGKLDGNDVEPVVDTYSVADYCYATLTEYKEETSAKHQQLKTLIVDLLNYGAAAQVYTNYNCANLVNSKLGEGQEYEWAGALASQEVGNLNSVTDPAQATIETPSVKWYSVALRLNNSVNIRYKLEIPNGTDLTNMNVQVKTGEGAPVVISSEKFVKAEGNYYYVYFDELNAGQMSTPFDATVYVNGEAVSNTLRYSVESYVEAKQNDSNEDLVNLLKEMIKYGYSAKAYVTPVAEN